MTCCKPKQQARQAWGESLTNRAEGERFSVAEITRAEARIQFRAAGDLYLKLAEHRFATRHYPQDLWESGTCYLQGQNYDQAIETLTRYLENSPRTNRPQGLGGPG